MLVLTRRTGEGVIIGEKGEIEIVILGISGKQIRIGINAPKEISVHREEIYERIKLEKEKK